MIAVEQLFTKSIPEIQKEQQNVQKEITIRNKELKDLFSSKYQELLNCTDLLNGISDYTKQIITITNQTQQNMMQINEQHIQSSKQQKEPKSKSFSYFIKKIKQSIKKGHLYNAQIALLYLQQKFQLNDYEKLYPTIILEQIASEINLNNIIDITLVHQDNLDYLFNHFVVFGSQNTNNFEIVEQKIQEIENIQNYQNLIMLKTEFINFTIDQIYFLLINNKIPQIQIDENVILSFQNKISKKTEKLSKTIIDNLISNIIQNDQFNHQLYQQIQSHQTLINQETKNQTIEIWYGWFKNIIRNHFDSISQTLSQQVIKTENDFLSMYPQYLQHLKNLNQSINNLNQLPYQQIEYKYDTCLDLIAQEFKEIQQIYTNIFETKKNSFEICFYYNILLFQQNQLFQSNQIKFYQEHNSQWDLKQIDQILFQLYKLQNQDIKRESITSIIKLMLLQVDIQFSIEYRNLATAIHPEKAQEFYQNLFQEGKFNNKQLKRLQLNLENNEQFETFFSNYTFLQKTVPKEAMNAWQIKAQEVQPKQEQQQQSRFGLNMFWKKQ